MAFSEARRQGVSLGTPVSFPPLSGICQLCFSHVARFHQKSTGFSPFHLLFGRGVRGPLLLLKDTWTNKDQSDAEAKPLYPYLFELKNILAESCELAMQNSSAASQRNKT